AILLLATVALNAALTFVAPGTAVNPAAAAAVGQTIVFVVIWAAFACVYRLLPDVRMRWRDVWLGAGVTAALFVIGGVLISLYLTRAGVASAYGAAGSLLATLLWLYYSAAIFLTGAEFTKAVARTATTTVPVRVRRLNDRPAGVDPRA
ncbi:MAG TPA: YhjD/YihY/BrkB family envelope integrity protein, partial [Candidatus Tumulicola sp.]|nr:YhjD/YihY/BrkB family envelope integrity protein [Candidatus Tumulicola sp.]